jgi:hypothetical protein
MTVEQEVNRIVKFVKELYSPYDVYVQGSKMGKYSIIFYFEEIDDRYIVNPQHKDQKQHKANMFKREIRDQIYNFFGIKTTGLQPNDYFSPHEEHPITIVVTYVNK